MSISIMSIACSRYAIVASMLVFVAHAYGQGTTLGFIYGQVDSSSGPVAGTTVTALHAETSRIRTAVSGADGRYRFSALAVGRYAVFARLDSLRTSIVPAEVNVGEGTSVELLLENPRAVEEVVVLGESVSLLDVTRSETARIVTSDDIQRLPILRDPNAVVLMAPGAVQGDSAFGSGRRGSQYSTGSGYASLGGASVAENVYYINGMNVTNFRSGLGASTIPFEFYDQFQIKTGGYGAEFGRSTGGVVNAVTKRGSNNWQYTVGGYFQPNSLRGHVPNVEHPSSRIEFDSADGFDETDDFNTFVSVSGPVVADRLFAYGIYEFRDIDVDDYSAYGRLHRETDDDGFWGVKLDWLVTDDHRVEYTGFSDKTTVSRESFRWDASTQTVGREVGVTDFSRGGDNHILTYRGYFGPRLATTLMWGTGEYDLTSRAPTAATCPVAIDSRSRGFNRLGCWTSFLSTGAYDEREVARVDIEWAAGDRHLLRFGMDQEVNTSFNRLEFSGGGFYQYFTAMPGDFLSNGGIVPDDVTQIVRYNQLDQGGHFDASATAFYVEDEWSLTALNATLRIGLRKERFDNSNAEDQSFIKITDQLAPRIGFSWDVGGDRDSKVFANFGRYHLPVANIVNVRMSSPTYYATDWFVRDQPIAEDGSTVLGTRIGEASIFADGSSPDVRTQIDHDIEPMAQDEFILGYERRILSDYILGITFTHRDLVQGIEDISIDEALGTFGEFNYVLANPGRDVRTFHDIDGDGSLDELNLSSEELGFPSLERRYNALTLDLQRRWDEVFYARASYTLSRSHGNYEGRVRSDTGEDSAGITTQFDFTGLVEGANGDLPNDRRHQLKAWGVWQFASRWQASAAFYFSSGRPRNAFGMHPSDPYARLYGPRAFYQQGELVPRGSLGTTEDTYRLDLGIKFNIDELAGGTLTARLDVINVLDLDTETEVDERADSYFGRRPSGTFGLPIQFQQPRTVRIGLRYEL